MRIKNRTTLPSSNEVEVSNPHPGLKCFYRTRFPVLHITPQLNDLPVTPYTLPRWIIWGLHSLGVARTGIRLGWETLSVFSAYTMLRLQRRLGDRCYRPRLQKHWITRRNLRPSIVDAGQSEFWQYFHASTDAWKPCSSDRAR